VGRKVRRAGRSRPGLSQPDADQPPASGGFAI